MSRAYSGVTGSHDAAHARDAIGARHAYCSSMRYHGPAGATVGQAHQGGDLWPQTSLRMASTRIDLHSNALSRRSGRPGFATVTSQRFFPIAIRRQGISRPRSIRRRQKDLQLVPVLVQRSAACWDGLSASAPSSFQALDRSWLPAPWWRLWPALVLPEPLADSSAVSSAPVSPRSKPRDTQAAFGKARI